MAASSSGCLDLIEAHLDHAGVVCARIAATESAPDQLIVLLDVDASDDEQAFEQALRFHLFFVPGFEDPSVLQYFIALPVTIEAGYAAALAEFLCVVNSSMPITGFEMSGALGIVAFRHTHAISAKPFAVEVVEWTLAMLHSVIHQSTDLIIAVAAGLAPAKATEELNNRLRAG
jgi:hypothetical protein